MTTGTIHAANPAKSARMQRVIEVLRDGLPHTTRELIELAGVCAVNSIIAELRKWGFHIECRFVGRSQNRMAIYAYRMLSTVGDCEYCGAPFPVSRERMTCCSDLCADEEEHSR